MVREGYKQTEVGEIPEDWDVKSLVSQLKESPRYGIGAAAVPLQGNIPVYIRITDISEDGYFEPTERVGVNHSDAGDYVLENGDLVFARTGASVGKSYLYRPDDGSLVYAGFLIKVSPNPDKLISSYLFQFTKTRTYWNWVRVMSMRSGQPGINGTEYGQMLLPVPNLEEQKGIAKALSDVDEFIVSLEKLIAKKKDIKTATIQQLLTGKKRLPGFGEGKGYQQSELGKIPEDWNVKSLITLLKGNPSYGIGAAAVPLEGNLPVYIRITDISEDGYFAPTEKVGVNHKDASNYTLENGDLVFARTGASVGKSYLYRPDDGQLIYAGFLIKVTPNPDKLISSYLFQFTKTRTYWNWVRVMSMRSGQPGINGAEYGQMLLPVPYEKEEQKAIANVLSNMDKDIEALQQCLIKIQQIKQGMMQELLTGRTRLI